jgi:hypothetical protein
VSWREERREGAGIATDEKWREKEGREDSQAEMMEVEGKKDFKLQQRSAPLSMPRTDHSTPKGLGRD